MLGADWDHLRPLDRKQRKRLLKALRNLGESNVPEDPLQAAHVSEAFRQFDDATAGDRVSEEAFDQLIAAIEASAGGGAQDAPLLPYRSGGAWIAKGVTKMAASQIGELEIDGGMVRLLLSGVPLATCSVAEVSVQKVLVWFGREVRLDMGAAGRWYVQPRYSVSTRRARRATRAFQRALAEAQGHPQ